MTLDYTKMYRSQDAVVKGHFLRYGPGQIRVLILIVLDSVLCTGMGLLFYWSCRAACSQADAMPGAIFLPVLRETGVFYCLFLSRMVRWG